MSVSYLGPRPPRRAKVLELSLSVRGKRGCGQAGAAEAELAGQTDGSLRRTTAPQAEQSRMPT